MSSLAQHCHLEASRALGIRVEPRKSRASKATSRREPPAWCRAPAVHEEYTSTVSARWVLRARRSRAGIHRIGARSGPAAHQHAWSRPTPRPPAGSPRSTRCTNATPTTTAVVVVVDGRARARSRLYSAAHRVPSTTYQHGRLWLCALEQQEHLLQQRTNGRVGYARFGSNLPRVPSEQGTDAGAGRLVVLTWAGKDAPPGRAARRLDDHEARRSLVGRDSAGMY